MAPNTVTTTTTVTAYDDENEEKVKKVGIESLDGKRTENSISSSNKNNNYFETNLIWSNIIAITLFHGIALYGLIMFPYSQKIKLFFFEFVYGNMGGFGVTAGVHRFWCHRAYKATLPLRIFLMICFSMAGQNTIYDWVRDHRIHHKFSETPADPHDSNRGFFFSHVGWLMMRKHPEVIKKGRVVDMSDILADPVVQFHHKYFTLFKLFFAFALPTFIPCYFLGESLYYSALANTTRYIVGLNFTWLVNSAAHIFGYRPYDKTIKPKENILVSFFALGEGWHNYHHTFPWDYKAGELGKLNVTAFWLRVFSWLGLAYDLKEPSDELVRKVIEKNGDGTYGWHEEVPPPKTVK